MFFSVRLYKGNTRKLLPLQRFKLKEIRDNTMTHRLDSAPTSQEDIGQSWKELKQLGNAYLRGREEEIGGSEEGVVVGQKTLWAYPNNPRSTRHLPASSGQPLVSRQKAPFSKAPSSLVEVVKNFGEKEWEGGLSTSSPSEVSSAHTTSMNKKMWCDKSKAAVPPVEGSSSQTSAGERKRNALSPSSSGYSAQEQLSSQNAMLRRWFSDAHTGINVVRMKKKRNLYLSECKQFRKAHNGRQPTAKEVSPYVNLELAPIAALKTWRHLSKGGDESLTSAHNLHRLPPSSCNRIPTVVPDGLQDGLLLQQHARQHELARVQGKTWFRCLRCFHAFFSNPHRLLTSPSGGREADAGSGSQRGRPAVVQLSWVQQEQEKEKQLWQSCAYIPKGIESGNQALTYSMFPKSKKRRLLERRKNQEKEKNEPRVCPHCGSPKVQWALDYIHHRTHMQ